LKIKRVPEDFQVFELAEIASGPRGPQGLYELEKRGLSTFEAIRELARHLKRSPRTISAGGLKDKHAVTRQLITISGKPVKPLRMKGLKLTPRGRTETAITGAHLRGNRFRIVLRELPAEMLETLLARARLAAEGGLPNYFDEQRFGSLRGGEGFIARKLIDGDFETGLRLHLAAPSRLDSSGQRARRKRLAELWGKWDEAFAVLPRGNERSVVNYLRDHPLGFKRAFELIERRLAQLYLFAYQSYIWNEILAGVLRRRSPADKTFDVRYAPGRLLFCAGPTRESLGSLAGVGIPLPSKKAEYPDGDVADAAAEALSSEGLTLEQFRLRGMKRLRFRAGERVPLVRPAGLKCSAPQPDEIYEGRHKLRLEFEMPPGAYATIVLKYVGRELLPGSRASRASRGRHRSRRR